MNPYAPITEEHELALGGGQDNSAEQTVQVKPISMINCRYDKVNGPRKRYGITKMNTSSALSPGVESVKPSVGVNAVVGTVPLALMNVAEVPTLVTNTSVNSWSTQNDCWTVLDKATTVPAREVQVYGAEDLEGVSISSVDTATTDAYTITVWIEGTTAYASLIDATTLQPIIDKCSIDPGVAYSQARVCRIVYPNAEQGFIIGLRAGTGATGVLYLSTFAASNQALGGGVVSTGLTVGIFDISSVRNVWKRYCIFYHDGTNYTLKTYNNLFANLQTSTPLAGTCKTLNVEYGPDYSDSAGSASIYAISSYTTTGANVGVRAFVWTDSNLSAAGPYTQVVSIDTSNTATRTTITPPTLETTSATPTVLCSWETSSSVRWCRQNRGALAAVTNGDSYQTSILSGTTPGGLGQVLLTNKNASVGVSAYCLFPTTTTSSDKPQVSNVHKCRVKYDNTASVGGTYYPPPPRMAPTTDNRLLCATAYSPATTTFTSKQNRISLFEHGFSPSGSFTPTFTMTTSSPYFSQGVVRYCDGGQQAEAQFYDQPYITATTSGSGSTLTAGTYAVTCIWTWSDALGRLMRSAPAAPVTLSGITAGVNVVVTAYPPQITDTHWPNKKAIIETYLSGVDNSQALYLANTVAVDATTGSQTITLTAPASTANRQLYTTGGVLDNVCPPGGTALTQHQQRLWVGGTPDDSIWYSQSFLNGEVPGFSEGLQKQAFEGGRVVALASSDTTLVIFKSGGIYGITGDGPDDTGSEATDSLSLPFRIQSETGCVDRKSVVMSPLGICFRGRRGIYLLDRGLNVKYIGQPIEDQLISSLTITDSVYYERDSQIWFLTDSSSVFVYDLLNAAWSVFTFKNSAGAAITPSVATVCSGVLYFVDSAVDLYKYDVDTSLDSSTQFVVMQWRSPFMKRGVSLGWQRVRRVTLRGRRVTDVNATINLYFDYDDTTTETRSFTYENTTTWTASTTPREMDVVPLKQKCGAISIEYIDSAPTAGGISTGVGTGFVLQAVCLELLQKSGRVRTKSDQMK